MQEKLNKGEANVIIDNENLELWDKRLGHMSEKELQILTKKQVVPISISKNLESCIDYLARKQHRISFIKSSHSHRRKACVRLALIDICFMIEKSLGSSLYFIIFINNHSKKVWVFLLKSKDQVLNVFKEFHARVEKEANYQLKCVRADNGGEY